MLDAEHLRNKWGAQVWTLDRIADKCERPERFDYAALVETYSPDLSSVRIDRQFRDGESFDWRGYRLTVDWMPGQTEFGLAVRGIIDGRSVVFTGDNLFGDPHDPSQNGHEAVVARNSSVLEEGYIYAAQYLKRIQPDLILGGHSYVMDRPADMIDRYAGWAVEMRSVFQALSTGKDYRYWYDPYWVRAEPYRSVIRSAGSVEVTVHVRNFRDVPESHRIEVHTPPGLKAEPGTLSGTIPGSQRREYKVRLQTNGRPAPGVRIVAFDVTLDGRRYGEWFDAVVDVQ
jgi:glyoxylase-like metal-dependent hydrolase (beta-lactamase superfamily II)